MLKTSWRLQDAKAQFSAVVDAAMNGEVQLVTRRGKRAVVVLDAGEYERLRQGERAQAPGFIEHLLAMPRPAKAQRQGAEPRPTIRLRDAVFE
jgi:antitoxin Phd